MLTLFCLFSTAMSLHKWKRKKEKAVSSYTPIVQINNKSTGMLNKSEMLEAYSSDGLRLNPLG